MEYWNVEEDHLISLIYEINRLGQTLLKFNEQAYGPFFSSMLAGITLRMLGLDGASPEKAGEDGISGDGIMGFDAGPYSYLFNSEVFLNENLIGEILAGIRQNSESFYKTKAQTTETGSSVVWIIEERFIMDLIREVHSVGRSMGRLEDDAWEEYFSTDLPDIILKMLGIPEDYSGIPYEDYAELVKPGDDENENSADEKLEEESAKHPAAYSRSYDYDIFNYSMSDESLEKFLDHTRERRDEYRQIRTEQAKLGDKLHEPDAYDALYDALIEGVKAGKISSDQSQSGSEDHES
jgi:hypothetical protein